MLPRCGKVPASGLKEFVFCNLGAKSDRVLLGPAVGEDAAIIRMDGKVLALKTDPITAAVDDIGWLAVHINANDLAVRGIHPAWFLSTILLPRGSSEETLQKITQQIHEACVELGVAVVGGHSEITTDVGRPVVVGVMAGEGESYVTTAGAAPGDVIVMTKSAGIEATRILASDLGHVIAEKLPANILEEAKGLKRRIGITRDAMIAMEAGGVHAMHDPTEGGILTGLWELSEASGHGLTAYEDRIAVADATREVCKIFQVDPLSVMGSGALLLTAEAGDAESIMARLRQAGIPAAVIGQITFDQHRRMVKVGGYGQEITPPDHDPLYDVLEKFGTP